MFWKGRAIIIVGGNRRWKTGTGVRKGRNMRLNVDRFIWPLGGVEGQRTRKKMTSFEYALIMHPHAVKIMHKRALIPSKSMHTHFGCGSWRGGEEAASGHATSITDKGQISTSNLSRAREEDMRCLRHGRNARGFIFRPVL